MSKWAKGSVSTWDLLGLDEQLPVRTVLGTCTIIKSITILGMKTFKIEQVPSQKGRIAIVTGANSGLGYETALALARKDIHVVMACRSSQRAQEAHDKILQQVPKAQLEILLIDLSKLDSVRQAATQYLEGHDRLDLLINNAGVMMPPYQATEDGFELQMGANYFGHFLLTGMLLPLILKTPHSRIVSLSSVVHRRGEIDFKQLQQEHTGSAEEKKNYSPMKSYAQSKLACLMYGLELQRRLEASGYTHTLSTIAHPGVSPTNLSQHIPVFAQKIFMSLLCSFFTHSPREGAKPTLWAALGPADGGNYFGPQNMQEMKGPPGHAKIEPKAKDQTTAQRLWELSEKRTGMVYDFETSLSNV